MDDNADPSAGLMNVSIALFNELRLVLIDEFCFQMMKKMYDDGDDEMKRTIAKAWTESLDKKNPMTPML